MTERKVVKKKCENPECENIMRRSNRLFCSVGCANRMRTGRGAWQPHYERQYVRNLGTGKYSLGSDLRHPRKWWLKKYLEATENMQSLKHIEEGRAVAKKLLSSLGEK